MRTRFSHRRPIHKSRFVEMFGDGRYREVAMCDASSKIADGTHKTPRYQSSGVKFISAKNIVDGQIDLSDVKYITEDEYFEIQKRCKLEVGDLLLTKSGSLGSVALVDRSERLGLFESLAIIKFKRDLLEGLYLKAAMSSPSVQRQFRQGEKGVAVKHLHLNVIAKTKIPLPPLSLQREFAAFVEEVDKSKFEARRLVEKFDILYRAKLQEYFA